MKIMTVLGTRPEIIRLSLIIKRLDTHVNHTLVHTGQNYAESLNDIFFKDLEIRQPNHHLHIKASGFGEQAGRIIAETEKLMNEQRPDKILILGDTNSGLSSIVAKRLGIPVYHMEAGNRCYDDRVPEEVNRRIIDHTSDVLLPYTHRSMQNLVREGIPRERIYVIGNPIFEVLTHFSGPIDSVDIRRTYGVETGKYFLVTMHRAESVDHEAHLRNLVESLNSISRNFNMPVLVSLHPRTKSRIDQFGVKGTEAHIQFLTPMGFFDFTALERKAFCVLSDSGTVQEECCIFKVPSVTLREVTERPETIECGSNVLSGYGPDRILQLVNFVTTQPRKWNPPPEYLEPAVADKVVKILLGNPPLVRMGHDQRS